MGGTYIYIYICRSSDLMLELAKECEGDGLKVVEEEAEEYEEIDMPDEYEAYLKAGVDKPDMFALYHLREIKSRQ